jgi:PAS domain-containing protein
LRTIVNHLPSLVSYWDRDLRNLFANHLHRDLFGVLPEVLRGQRLVDVVGPVLMARHGPMSSGAGRPGPDLRMGGAPARPAATHLAGVLGARSARGRVAGIFAQLMDISDRKQAESQLFEEKERFRVTLSSIGDAVITVDVDGRVTYLNPVAEMMTDWRLDLARGEPVETVMPIVNSVDGQPLRNPVRLALELQEGGPVGRQCPGAPRWPALRHRGFGRADHRPAWRDHRRGDGVP